MQDCFNAAIKLHQYLVSEHWRENGLWGPDPGIRLNYRIGRFAKSYLPQLTWNDDLYYLQSQGYWVLANWRLFQATSDEHYRQLAVLCSIRLLACQRDDGAWDYPNPEWKGRVATAEGTWGSLGLVETFRQTGEARFLEGALCWWKYLVDVIGFERIGEELSINYFANLGSTRVPNNSAFVLRFLADLSDATGDAIYLDHCDGMLTFLEHAQRDSGEFPYVAQGPGTAIRPHFQCYQYNAFMCLDLIKYFELRGVRELPRLVLNVLEFLRSGLSPTGYAYYDCATQYRTFSYHTAVLGAAFREADRWGTIGYAGLADLARNHLLNTQLPAGGFFHSRGDYRLLSDRRSYPRYLAMILLHLLMQDSLPQKELVSAPDKADSQK